MSKAKQPKKKEEETTTKKSTPKKSNIPLVKYLWGVVVAILVFAMYFNSINHDYTLDDIGAINENRYVLEGFSGIPKLMKIEFWHFQNTHLSYYRPLSLITFAIENEFTKNNPQLGHFINVLIFAFSTFLLFLVLSKLFRNTHALFAFAATVLYAAHPLHTEVVANIKGRDELLSFLNIMAMIWFTLKFIDTKKISSLIASLIFCYLGMLSKETALTGVLLLPVVIFYYTDLSILECLKKTALPFAVVLIFFMQKKLFLGTLSGVIPVDIVNYPYTQFAVKIPTTFFLFAFCLKLLIFPHPLRYEYSYNQIPAVGFTDIWAILGILLFFTGLYFTYKQAMKKTVWGFALAVFYITLVPSLAFTILRGGIFAERFLFAPSLGFCIALVYGIALLTKTDFSINKNNLITTLKSNLKLVGPVLVIMILYGFKTITRNTAWKDDYTLFSTDIKTGENSAQNQRHLAKKIIDKAALEKDSTKKAALANEAVNVLKQALKIHPKFGEAYYLTGYVYQIITPNLDTAIYYYQKAIQTAPSFYIPYFNVGIIYQMRGDNEMASFHYNEAVRYNPEFQEARNAADNLRKLGIDVRTNPMLNRAPK